MRIITLLYNENLDIKKFLEGAKLAIRLIITERKIQNSEVLTHLIDSRYINSFLTAHSEKYDEVKKEALENLQLKITNAQRFANNFIIKVSVKLDKIFEEWTFFKKLNTYNHNWQLSNIEAIE